MGHKKLKGNIQMKNSDISISAEKHICFRIEIRKIGIYPCIPK